MAIGWRSAVKRSQHDQHLGVAEHQPQVFQLDLAVLDQQQDLLAQRSHRKPADDDQKQLLG